MPTSDADLRRLIERCERVLSTPGGVTELDWDSLAPGEDLLSHLAYLQRIASMMGVGLGLPPEATRQVREVNRRRKLLSTMG